MAGRNLSPSSSSEESDSEAAQYSTSYSRPEFTLPAHSQKRDRRLQSLVPHAESSSPARSQRSNPRLRSLLPRSEYSSPSHPQSREQGPGSFLPQHCVNTAIITEALQDTMSLVFPERADEWSDNWGYTVADIIIKRKQMAAQRQYSSTCEDGSGTSTAHAAVNPSYSAPQHTTTYAGKGKTPHSARHSGSAHSSRQQGESSSGRSGKQYSTSYSRPTSRNPFLSGTTGSGYSAVGQLPVKRKQKAWKSFTGLEPGEPSYRDYSRPAKVLKKGSGRSYDSRSFRKSPPEAKKHKMSTVQRSQYVLKSLSKQLALRGDEEDSDEESPYKTPSEHTYSAPQHTTTYTGKGKTPHSARHSGSAHSSRQQGESSSGRSSKRSGSTAKRVVALDCEMVGCQPDAEWLARLRRKGKRKKLPSEVSVAGRCTIVDYNGDVLYDSHIRPNLEIITLRTCVSGITYRDLNDATPFDEARQEVMDLLRDRLVVAHDIKHDLSSLQLSLRPESIRDTSTCTPLRKLAGMPLSHPHAALRKLAKNVLGRDVQTELPHSSLKDARVAMELYRAVEEEWEREEEVDTGW